MVRTEVARWMYASAPQVRSLWPGRVWEHVAGEWRSGWVPHLIDFLIYLILDTIECTLWFNRVDRRGSSGDLDRLLLQRWLSYISFSWTLLVCHCSLRRGLILDLIRWGIEVHVYSMRSLGQCRLMSCSFILGALFLRELWLRLILKLLCVVSRWRCNLLLLFEIANWHFDMKESIIKVGGLTWCKRK